MYLYLQRHGVVFLLVIGISATLVGCRLGGDFATGPSMATAPAPTGTADLRLAITLPPAASQLAPDGAVRAAATGTRQVTFTLWSLNVANPTSPVTTASKTVTVDASGHASATFTGVPVLPILANAQISSGTIGSYSIFHGGRDLVLGSNTLTLEGTGSRSTTDITAAVLARLIASPTLLVRASSPLVAGIASMVAVMNRTSATVYDDAFAMVANSFSQTTAFSPDITFTLGNPTGAQIPRALGLNSGPSPVGDSVATVTTQYQQIGVETIRIHDYYGPLDMATLYPNHSADPNLATSYNYTNSDLYYQEIVNGGFAAYWRIGDSYDLRAPYVSPNPRQPTNNTNYIQASIKIIQHYNDAARWGRSPISTIEVWNEPDFTQFWGGSYLEFVNFFASAAVAVKAAFPNAKVGGPGFTMNAAVASSTNAQFLEIFLATMASRSVPLDFFSWHMYSNTPANFASAASYFRGRLNHYGFVNTKMHNTEFHTDTTGFNVQEARELRVGGKGAAILTAAWINLINTDHEQTYVFRGNDTNINNPEFYGLFDAAGNAKRPALAFSLWKTQCDHATRLAVTTAGTVGNTIALAGANGSGEITMLVANFGATAYKWNPSASTGGDLLGRYTATVKTVSDAATTVETATVSTLPITSPAYSVQLLTLTPR